MNSYTIEELEHLRDVRAIGFDDYHDSGQTNEKQDFLRYTDYFFKWLDKMEKRGKIQELLSTIKK